MQCGESCCPRSATGVVDRLLKAGVAEIAKERWWFSSVTIQNWPINPSSFVNGMAASIMPRRYRHRRLSHQRIESRRDLVRGGRAAELAFQTIRRPGERLHRQLASHHIWQRSWRRPQTDENALRRGCPCASFYRGSLQATRKIIDEKNPDLSDKEKNDIAEKIGIGAVKYADLWRHGRRITFFHGTGCFRCTGTPRHIPQNAYVRIRSILRKAGELTSRQRGLRRAAGPWLQP